MSKTRKKKAQFLDQKYLFQEIQEYVFDRFKIDKVRYVRGGMNYNFLLGEEPKYFLKLGIAHPLDAQAYALKVLSKGGISVPDFILYDNEQTLLPYDVLVSRYIPHNKSGSCSYKELGRACRLMHSIDVPAPGWGMYLEDLKGARYPTWHEATYHVLGRQNQHIEKHLKKNVNELLPDLEQFTPSCKACLHLDFVKDNVLTEDGKVIAIIDPGGYFGDPLYDVAYCLSIQEKEESKEFLQGYFSRGIKKEEKIKIEKYQAVHLLLNIAYRTSEIDDLKKVEGEQVKEQIKEKVLELRKILQKLANILNENFDFYL